MSVPDCIHSSPQMRKISRASGKLQLQLLGVATTLDGDRISKSADQFKVQIRVKADSNEKGEDVHYGGNVRSVRQADGG